jgi:FixJ family two-component response regulator
MRQGAVAYLTKPFTREQLIRAINLAVVWARSDWDGTIARLIARNQSLVNQSWLTQRNFVTVEESR